MWFSLDCLFLYRFICIRHCRKWWNIIKLFGFWWYLIKTRYSVRYKCFLEQFWIQHLQHLHVWYWTVYWYLLYWRINSVWRFAKKFFEVFFNYCLEVWHEWIFLYTDSMEGLPAYCRLFIFNEGINWFDSLPYKLFLGIRHIFQSIFITFLFWLFWVIYFFNSAISLSPCLFSLISSFSHWIYFLNVGFIDRVFSRKSDGFYCMECIDIVFIGFLQNVQTIVGEFFLNVLR